MSEPLARLYGDQSARNLGALDRLAAAFTAMLCGILVVLRGLALAAIVG